MSFIRVKLNPYGFNMEKSFFLESTLDKIFNSIIFASLRIFHKSIITLRHLVNSLQEISHSLPKNSVHLPVSFSTVSKYIDFIIFEAYQTESKIVSSSKITLIDSEMFAFNNFYPHIPDRSSSYATSLVKYGNICQTLYRCSSITTR